LGYLAVGSPHHFAFPSLRFFQPCQRLLKKVLVVIPKIVILLVAG
jgi:hypothetical protein